jgi:hypothetical protein
MNSIETPFDSVKVRKPDNPARKTSPSEDAAVVALAVAGASEADIASQLGRSASWVSRRKKLMRAEIEEHRRDIVLDQAEDYSDIISLTLFRIRERLTNDDTAAATKLSDLAVLLKNVFTSRQLMLEAPTKIEATVEGGLKGRQLVEALATAEAFNQNFSTMMRAQIAADVREVDLDVVEGDVEEID